jgi:hypothetical protein
VNCLTTNPFPPPYTYGMAQKTYQPLDTMHDLRTDYLLIAMGIGTAVLALAYLLMA